MSWLFFAITTYAFYSVTNFIEKFLIDKKIKYPATATILGGSFTFLVSIVIFSVHGFHLLPFVQILLLFTSGILLTLYLIPYFYALSLDDASRVVPLFQFFPIFVLIIAFLFLHENLTVKQFVGFFFITIGGLLLGIEKFDSRFFHLRKSFWYMILASFLYALTGIIFKYIASTDFWLTIAYQTMGIGIGAFFLLLYNPYRKHFLEEIRFFDTHIFQILTINQCISLLAEFSYFYAITLAPIALVSVMQGIQPVFLLLYGLILTRWFPHIIKEDIRRETIVTKLVSIIILCMGIYCIYL